MLKEKMMRYKLMDSHMDLVKRGELGAARILLQLLRNGKVTLGLAMTNGTWKNSAKEQAAIFIIAATDTRLWCIYRMLASCGNSQFII